MKEEEVLKELQEEILTGLKEKINLLGKDLGFAIIQVGKNPISTLYVEKKEEMAKKLNIKCKKFVLDEEIDETELIVSIKEISSDTDISGIMVQLPLPSHIDTRRVLDSIDPDKDIDGLNSDNLGKLFTDQDAFYPATPTAVTILLDKIKVNIEGKRVVVIGGSNLVGKPLGMILLNKGATVTTCHTKTKNLAEIARSADILIVAIGHAKFITQEFVKKGAVVIDIGINREDGKVFGDADHESVSGRASFLTPVPGGIGPLTVLALMKNILKSAKK